MKTYENETFTRFRDRDSRAVFSDVVFRECHFDDCAVSLTDDPALRSTIRSVSLIDCSKNGGSIGTAIVEDVLVDSFRAPGLFQTFGAVFKHVVLRGKFDRLMISNDVLPDLSLNRPYQYKNVDAFREANNAFYRKVEWALDISRGEFKELDIRGIPGHLIRRDPETQILVTRQSALRGDWRDLPFEETLTSFSLDFMLQEKMPDLVLVAPKRHRKFKRYLHDIQLLRQAGIAEPD